MQRIFLAFYASLVVIVLPAQAVASEADYGDELTVHFTLKLPDNSIVTTTRDKEPLQLILGETAIVKGLEAELHGMEPGEKKQIVVPPDLGYGPYNNKKLVTVDRDSIPAQNISPGMMLEGIDPETKKKVRSRVVQVKPDVIVLDFNHPMAGKELHFDVELVEVIEKH